MSINVLLMLLVMVIEMIEMVVEMVVVTVIIIKKGSYRNDKKKKVHLVFVEHLLCISSYCEPFACNNLFNPHHDAQGLD